MVITDPIFRSLISSTNANDLAGAVTAVWRNGKLVQQCAAGWRDVDARLQVERDTLFRIASMTKPITAIAALLLHEEGHFALNDPITRWAPEFASMRVLHASDGPLDATVPALRTITFDDLLTHRAGFTYGDFHTGPIANAYASNRVPNFSRPYSTTERVSEDETSISMLS